MRGRLLCFLLALGAANERLAAMTDRQESANIEYCAELQRRIGIIESSQSVPEFVREALRLSRSGTLTIGDLDRLARKLETGAAPASLAAELEASTTVTTRLADNGLELGLGTQSERTSIRSRFAAREAEVRVSAPALAKACAKSCIVLAAQEGLLQQNSVPLVLLLKNRELCASAGLSPEAQDMLLKWASTISRDPVALKHEFAAARFLERLIAFTREDRAPLPGDHVTAFCREIQQASELADGHPAAEFGIAQQLWRCACLARTFGDAAAASQLADAVNVMRGSATDFGARIYGEAISAPGPRPKDSGVRFMEHPDDWKPKR